MASSNEQSITIANKDNIVEQISINESTFAHIIRLTYEEAVKLWNFLISEELDIEEFRDLVINVACKVEKEIIAVVGRTKQLCSKIKSTLLTSQELHILRTFISKFSVFFFEALYDFIKKMREIRKVIVTSLGQLPIFSEFLTYVETTSSESEESSS